MVINPMRKLTIYFDEDASAFSMTTLFMDADRNVTVNVYSKDTRNTEEETLSFHRVGNDFEVEEIAE